MKRFTTLLFVAVISVFMACSTTPKPKSPRVGVLMGYMDTFIDKDFGVVRQGSYKNNVMLRLENQDTGEAVFAFTQNGFFTYHNLVPGTYALVNWKLYFSGSYESYAWFHVYITPKPIIVEIKPNTVTMISKFKSSAITTREGEWNYVVEYLPTDKSELENEFREDPKNKYWQDFQIEYVPIKSK